MPFNSLTLRRISILAALFSKWERLLGINWNLQTSPNTVEHIWGFIGGGSLGWGGKGKRASNILPHYQWLGRGGFCSVCAKSLICRSHGQRRVSILELGSGSYTGPHTWASTHTCIYCTIKNKILEKLNLFSLFSQPTFSFWLVKCNLKVDSEGYNVQTPDLPFAVYTISILHFYFDTVIIILNNDV